MNEKRNKLFTIKCSQSEKEKWQKIAKSHEQSLSKYVRNFLESSKPKRKVKTKMKKVDPMLIFEINAIENNINQISKKLNSGESFTLEMRIVLYSIDKHLEEIRNAHKIH